jgi:hypothetical protein
VVCPGCDLEASIMRKPRTTRDCCVMEKLLYIVRILSCRLRWSFERTILMPKNLFGLRCVHSTRVADGTHQISTYAPLIFKHLSHLVTSVYLKERIKSVASVCTQDVRVFSRRYLLQDTCQLGAS